MYTIIATYLDLHVNREYIRAFYGILISCTIKSLILRGGNMNMKLGCTCCAVGSNIGRILVIGGCNGVTCVIVSENHKLV
jgi:hypothetical protein